MNPKLSITLMTAIRLAVLLYTFVKFATIPITTFGALVVFYVVFIVCVDIFLRIAFDWLEKVGGHDI